MKCYYHNDQEAVAVCSVCGKYLCKACAGKFVDVLCKDCAASKIEECRKYNIKNISIAAVLFCVGIVLNVALHGGFRIEALGIAYCLAALPWGWSALTKITPSIFLTLPLVGWLIYFAIKGFLAVIIGWIVMPIKFFKSFRDLEELKKSRAVLG